VCIFSTVLTALREVVAPEEPKVILLMGKAAQSVFCNAFRDHADIAQIASLSWEVSSSFLASDIALLSHPGQLGLNARMRRPNLHDVTSGKNVFLRDVETVLKLRFPQFTVEQPPLSLREFKVMYQSEQVHPDCPCQSHPGRMIADN
jgi:hypothetical protein